MLGREGGRQVSHKSGPNSAVRRLRVARVTPSRKQPIRLNLWLPTAIRILITRMCITLIVIVGPVGLHDRRRRRENRNTLGKEGGRQVSHMALARSVSKAAADKNFMICKLQLPCSGWNMHICPTSHRKHQRMCQCNPVRALMLPPLPPRE